jgi:glycosyltransferase involved in cell wall biosynthesis
MAMATPVLAAAGGGHLETVGGCAGAHLFTPADVEDCATKLDELVADDARRASYGEALQRHQRAHLDIQRHADELVRLYERLV